MDDEIKAVATMASLLLGLLVFFTGTRRTALEKLGDIDAFSPKTVWTALPDIGLAAFTMIALSLMAPLLFDSFTLAEAWHRSGALVSMFGLIWIGFAAVLAVQLSILWGRFVPAFRAWREEYRERRQQGSQAP